MSIVIKKKAENLPKLLGLDDAYAAFAKHGVQVFYQGTDILFEVPGHPHPDKHVFGVSGAVMSLLLYEMVDGIPDYLRSKLVGLISGIANDLKTKKEGGKKKKPTPYISKALESEIDAMTPVPLKDATMLYQPVFGTSTGSRYQVVAICDGMKIAARYVESTKKLSIRAEGEKINGEYEEALLNAGLTATAETHKSLHVFCSNMVLAARVLGGVLSSIGVDFYTPVPNPNKALTHGV